ncbi:hypothetical protein GCM10011506_17290 [Marivirga lumbricoides]|uniref:Peptidase M1 membrane alanine aminopeptidase domain-containing protein n=2 Tax=Marivirga lumbricoides TaxID=1046115 RepID=A0ABQ1M359_9BACT|nr:hypothetical protein GCM10011506_17290 [Marivirga lumbricoides]
MNLIAKALASFILLFLSILPRPSIASDLKPFYELHVSIKPEAGSADVALKLDVPVNLLMGDSLSFLFSADAQVAQLNGDHLSSYNKEEAGPGLSFYTLKFKDFPMDIVSISMKYTVTIPADHQVNRITKDWIELNIDSFWHPVLTSFSRFHYQLTTDLDKSYRILTGDDVKSIGKRTKQRVIESVIPRIDISFSASKHFYSIEGNYSSIYTTNSFTNLDSLLMFSERAISFLKGYIKRPDDFKQERIVVESPRKEVGYARENYVVLSKLNGMDSVYLSRFLAHEFAHFWFSTANSQSQDHWLNESFAEFVSMIFVREAYGEAVYEADLQNKLQRVKGDPRSLDSFRGRPSHLAMYFTGPLILHYFEEFVGKEQFQMLIQEMINQRISTTENLLVLVREQLGTAAEEKLIQLRAREFE